VFANWAFQVESGAASRRYWDRIPLGTDVVITHGPPFGALDKPDILASRLGCQDLIKAILRVRPKLHVFGHIHGGYGHEVCRTELTWSTAPCWISNTSSRTRLSSSPSEAPGGTMARSIAGFQNHDHAKGKTKALFRFVAGLLA
jgi:hypothetical protein